MPESAERSVMAGLVVVVTVASFLLLWPLLPWILFAIWAGTLARPLHTWLGNHLGQRPRLAAAVATLGLVLLVAPVIVLLASLTDDAVALVRRAVATDRVQNLLHALGSRNGSDAGSTDIAGLILSQGGRAWSLAQQIAGTAARVLIGLVIAIGGLYSVLVDGSRWYAWLEAHALVSTTTFRRLAGALVETGRGLFFGILGAGFAQAVVATGLYVALGVPQPYALGLLTLACSIIPAVGTSIVWLPVSIALAVSGHDVAAIVLLACGFLVIGTIDNFVRPYLIRRGHLQLPTFIVALAMFGGVATLGPRGVILGPLILRLAKEVLSIVRERPDSARAMEETRADH